MPVPIASAAHFLNSKAVGEGEGAEAIMEGGAIVEKMKPKSDTGYLEDVVT